LIVGEEPISGQDLKKAEKLCYYWMSQRAPELKFEHWQAAKQKCKIYPVLTYDEQIFMFIQYYKAGNTAELHFCVNPKLEKKRNLDLSCLTYFLLLIRFDGIKNIVTRIKKENWRVKKGLRHAGMKHIQGDKIQVYEAPLKTIRENLLCSLGRR